MDVRITRRPPRENTMLAISAI